MEKLLEILQHKGVLIGAITAFTKGVVQIRKRDFNLLVFFTDLILALIVGYVFRELVKDVESINLVIKIIFTFFMSGNAFVFVSIMFDKDLARRIFLNFMGKLLEQDLKSNNKKNEKSE